MPRYAILMGDIVNSAEQPARKLFRAFQATIDDTNRAHKQRLISPLTVTLGDEFQGVFRSLADAFDIALGIDYDLALKGISCRFAIGYGDIDTKVNVKKAWGMLGEGLTETREALNEKSPTNRYRFVLRMATEPVQKSLQTLGWTLTHLIEEWTQRQRQIVNITDQTPSTTEAVKKTRTSKENYYKTLRASNYGLYREVRETIAFLLKNEQRRNP